MWNQAAASYHDFQCFINMMNDTKSSLRLFIFMLANSSYISIYGFEFWWFWLCIQAQVRGEKKYVKQELSYYWN